MLDIAINVILKLFDRGIWWHVILSDEQIFSIAWHIIVYWQLLFYCLIVLWYLFITHKVCIFFGWWNKWWKINKRHVFTYIFMFDVWLLLWLFFIHPSRSNIEEYANTRAYKIMQSIEYHEWNWYVLNFKK